MYDINNKQYIIKQACGKTMNIFYKANSGAYSGILNKKGLWSEASLITKDILPGFSVCTDDLDKTHILCQDRQGHIKYITYENEKWDSRVILKSRNFSPYDKHLTAVTTEKGIHFFYTLRYSEKSLLSYQILKYTGELSDPKVIDYVSESPNPYMVQPCQNGDLYLFYTYQDSKYSRVGYKRYNAAKNMWSDFFPITEFNGESSIAACTGNYRNILYTCWQKHTGSGYELMLSVKTPDSEEWDKETIISKAQVQFANPSFIPFEDKWLAYWFKENTLFYSVSYDKGSTWSPAEAYSFPINEPLHCISYFSNFKDDEFYKQCTIIPGTIGNGYKFAFQENKKVEEKAPEPIRAVSDESQNHVINSLKLLSGDIGLVKKMLLDIDSKLSSLENNQNRLEVELGRYNSILQTDLSRVNVLLEDINLQIMNNYLSFETEKTNSVPTENKNVNQNEIHSQIPAGSQALNNTPIMPGAGFAGITPEFLRSLQKK